MGELTIVEAIRSTLESELARDERTMVLGQDVGRSGGVFRATDGLQQRFGAERVVDMPLAEGVIVGSAVGLAISGMVPVAEIQFLGFADQAFHQIADQVARMRMRSRGRYGLALTIRAPYGGGVRTPEMHSDAVETKYAGTPGLKVATPATAADAKGLLLSAIRDPDPVLFLEPLRGYRLVKDEVADDDVATPFGVARVAREGSDVTVIAWSAAVQVAQRAADIVAADGISAEVLDLRTLVPLDVEAISERVSRTGRAVVVHEAPLTAGYGAEVVATVTTECFYHLEAPVARVTSPDAPYPVGMLEEEYLPHEKRLAEVIRDVAAAP